MSDMKPLSPYAMAAAALTYQLEQLDSVLACIEASDYTISLPGGVAGTIGGHTRHTLDHVNALFIELGAPIDYDTRNRGTSVETDIDTARDTIKAQIDRLAKDRRDIEMDVSIQVDGSGTRVDAKSSLVREMAYVLSHTIHHNAMIAGIVTSRGLDLPEDFGYAPSTIKHQREQNTATPSS